MRNIGSFVGNKPAVQDYSGIPLSSTAPGVWDILDAARYREFGQWPSQPAYAPVVNSNLLAWWAADRAYDSSGNLISTDNTAVARLEGLSPNGNRATQSTSGNRPTWRNAANGVNGRPAIYFSNAALQWLTADTVVTLGGDFTIYMVCKLVNSELSAVPITAVTSGAGDFTWMGATGDFTSPSGASSVAIQDIVGQGPILGGPPPNTTPVFGIRAYQSGSTIGIRINSGTDITQAADILPFNFEGIGSINSVGYNAYGYFCEALIYNTYLGSSARSQTEAYLGAKWGVTP